MIFVSVTSKPQIYRLCRSHSLAWKRIPGIILSYFRIRKWRILKYYSILSRIPLIDVSKSKPRPTVIAAALNVQGRRNVLQNWPWTDFPLMSHSRTASSVAYFNDDRFESHVLRLNPSSTFTSRLPQSNPHCKSSVRISLLRLATRIDHNNPPPMTSLAPPFILTPTTSSSKRGYSKMRSPQTRIYVICPDL